MHNDWLFQVNEEKRTKSKKRKIATRPIKSQIVVRQTDNGWKLFTRYAGALSPAGPRLFRSQPWPIDRFSFGDDQSAAKQAAEKLAEYLGTEVEW